MIPNICNFTAFWFLFFICALFWLYIYFRFCNYFLHTRLSLGFFTLHWLSLCRCHRARHCHHLLYSSSEQRLSKVDLQLTLPCSSSAFSLNLNFRFHLWYLLSVLCFKITFWRATIGEINCWGVLAWINFILFYFIALTQSLSCLLTNRLTMDAS